jgi:hypothetical protein
MDTKIKEKTEKYLQLVIKHGEEILNGNSTNANKLHKKITAFMNKEGLDFTKDISLLQYPNTSVRLWVASNLLKKGVPEAIDTLRNIQNSDEIFSLNAPGRGARRW